MFKTPTRPLHALLTLLSLLLLLNILPWAACKDACEGVVCANGGTCVSGKCACTDGFFGDDCSQLYRDAFVGTYDVAEICGQGNYTYVLSITADPDNLRGVLMQNLGDFGLSFKATASANGLSFNETKQGLSVNGTAVHNGNVLSIQFGTSGSFVDNCNSTATKR